MTEHEITPEMVALQKSLFDNDFIKNIALSKFGGQTDRYGAFGKDALENTYMKTAGTAPNQNAYEALFGEAVLGNGSIHKEQLKQNAMKVWGSAMQYQTANDLAGKMGIDSIKDEYSGKTLAELDEQTRQAISSSYLQHEVTGLMKQGLVDEQKAISGGLEKVLNPQEEEEEEQQQRFANAA